MRIPTTWSRWAELFARDSHENNFSSRRGTYTFDLEGKTLDGASNVVVVYDNNPFTRDAGARDRMNDRIIREAARVGLRLLGRGSFPGKGDEREGYTSALVFGDCDGAHESLREILRRELDATMDELDNIAVWPPDQMRQEG